jgi:redox-sensitive bicupin YhaK (pirin superfamily)
MIRLRPSDSIHQTHGFIQNGTFTGRWHFSFDDYTDPEYVHFGSLRVLNDDTLSPGAVWPLHPHRNIEVVTYCAGGEFRHADELGEGQVLKKGWVQHTTVGRGMYHSEINNLADEPMRFIQMWFLPPEKDLEPGLQQKAVEPGERTGRFLPLVSNEHPGALPIFAGARVFSCRLTPGHPVAHKLSAGQGAYLYNLEGGRVTMNGQAMPALTAAMVTGEPVLEVSAAKTAELLLVEVDLS